MCVCGGGGGGGGAFGADFILYISFLKFMIE